MDNSTVNSQVHLKDKPDSFIKSKDLEPKELQEIVKSNLKVEVPLESFETKTNLDNLSRATQLPNSEY